MVIAMSALCRSKDLYERIGKKPSALASVPAPELFSISIDLYSLLRSIVSVGDGELLDCACLMINCTQSDSAVVVTVRWLSISICSCFFCCVFVVRIGSVGLFVQHSTVQLSSICTRLLSLN